MVDIGFVGEEGYCSVAFADVPNGKQVSSYFRHDSGGGRDGTLVRWDSQYSCMCYACWMSRGCVGICMAGLETRLWRLDVAGICAGVQCELTLRCIFLFCLLLGCGHCRHRHWKDVVVVRVIVGVRYLLEFRRYVWWSNGVHDCWFGVYGGIVQFLPAAGVLGHMCRRVALGVAPFWVVWVVAFGVCVAHGATRSQAYMERAGVFWGGTLCSWYCWP